MLFATFLLYLILLAALVLGLVLTLINMPGTWVMLAAAAGYAWLTGGAFVGLWTLVILLVLALIAEFLEFTSAGKAAKKAGGGRRAALGALIGGILGGIFLTFIPIPILSTIIGICLGTFIGALVGELSGGSDSLKSVNVGLGATRGRLMGMMIKLGFGFAMALITIVMAFPRGHASIVPTHPSTTPSTLPSHSLQ